MFSYYSYFCSMDDNNKDIMKQNNAVLSTQLVDDVKLIVERGMRQACQEANKAAVNTYCL